MTGRRNRNRGIFYPRCGRPAEETFAGRRSDGRHQMVNAFLRLQVTHLIVALLWYPGAFHNTLALFEDTTSSL